jgi:hypothetical protein
MIRWENAQTCKTSNSEWAFRSTVIFPLRKSSQQSLGYTWQAQST